MTIGISSFEIMVTNKYISFLLLTNKYVLSVFLYKYIFKPIFKIKLRFIYYFYI